MQAALFIGIVAHIVTDILVVIDVYTAVADVALADTAVCVVVCLRFAYILLAAGGAYMGCAFRLTGVVGIFGVGAGKVGDASVGAAAVILAAGLLDGVSFKRDELGSCGADCAGGMVTAGQQLDRVNALLAYIADLAVIGECHGHDAAKQQDTEGHANNKLFHFYQLHKY